MAVLHWLGIKKIILKTLLRGVPAALAEEHSVRKEVKQCICSCNIKDIPELQNKR